MTLFIINQPVALAADTVIDYTVENPLFSETEGYTLSIEIPLRGCPQNQRIFGALHRTDQPVPDIIYNARLQHAGYTRTGILKIIETGFATLTAQFLDGIAAQNADNLFENAYINEAFIEEPDPDYDHRWLDLDAELRGGIDAGYDFIELPWTNNYSGLLHNAVGFYPPTGKMVRTTTPPPGTTAANGEYYQIYMLHLVRCLLQDKGYTADLTEWAIHRAWRYLICCNVIPISFGEPGNYARALPHWTYNHFLAQLAQLMGGRFIINHATKHVTFQFRNTPYHPDNRQYYHVPPILDQYTRQTADTPDDTLPQQTIIEFTETPGQLAKYYAFPVPPEATPGLNILDCSSLADLAGCNTITAGTPTHLYHFNTFSDEETTLPWYHEYFTPFIDRYDPDTQTGSAHLVPVGCHSIPPQYQKLNRQKIDFCPVWLDFIDTAKTCFTYIIDCGEKDDDNLALSADNPKTQQQQMIEKLGDRQEQYHDRIYFGFWYGDPHNTITNINQLHPITTNFDLAGDQIAGAPGHYTLGQYCNPAFLYNQHNANLPDLDTTQTLTVHFLAPRIPDPESIFVVQGKRYLCRRCTTKFYATPIETTDPKNLLHIEAELVPIAE